MWFVAICRQIWEWITYIWYKFISCWKILWPSLRGNEEQAKQPILKGERRKKIMKKVICLILYIYIASRNRIFRPWRIH